MTDLSKLSNSDLRAIASGDLRMMSAEGLRLIASASKAAEQPDYESVLSQGSTLKVGPFDTGVEISPNTTQFLAGMGKRFSDIATLGMRDETDADKALMDKTPAMLGGGVADLASLVAGGTVLRGAGLAANAPKLAAAGKAMVAPSTLPKAATVGALWSGATTNGNASDRAKAATIGGISGAALPLAGAAYKTGKALVQPLTKSGQEAIAGQTLRRFAGENIDDVVARLNSPEMFVPGSIPSAAEASGNAGIAALQQGLANVDKGGFGNALDVAQKANRAARVNALQQIAGDDAAMAAAIQARNEASQSLYGKAFQSDKMRIDLAKEAHDKALPYAIAGGPVPSLEMPSKGLQDLAKRPAFKSAMDDAVISLKNRGMGEVPLNSLEGLHRIKLSLDEAINGSSEGSALARYSKSDLKAIKAKLIDEIEAVAPTYQAARKTYADMSAPINQMTIGNALLDKLRPALADFGANTRETASTYAKSLRDADALAAKSTGFSNAKMADVMSPEQMNTITGIAKDLARKASSEDMIRGVGSNTAQNLATQNILRQAFGPLGIPQSFAESAFLNTAMKPLNLVYQGVGEGRIAEALGRGLLDPKEAARLMTTKAVTRRTPQLINSLPVIPGAVIGPQFFE